MPREIILLAALCLAVRATTLETILAASAQPLDKLPPARAPCTVLSSRPCHPSFCDIFHRGPCFPEYGPAIGSDFRLTIVSTDTEPGGDRGAETGQGTDNPASAPADKTLKSMRAMYSALRACWVPPPKDEARHGMQYTVRLAFKRDGEIVGPPFVTYASHDAPPEVRDVYRDAVNAALARCTPLHFSDDMAEAVVGHPIAIRFVDDRTIDSRKSVQ